MPALSEQPMKILSGHVIGSPMHPKYMIDYERDVAMPSGPIQMASPLPGTGRVRVDV